MEKGRFILICIFILSVALGTTKGEPQVSQEYLQKELPRSLEVSGDNYIIVEYRNFTGNLNGFRSRNIEMNKARIYLNDNDIDYFFNNQTMEIKSGSKIKIQFINPLTSMAYLFHNMTKIKSIDFSNFNSKEVTDMSLLFNLCTGLENITFGNNFNTSKVTNMNGLFYGCSSIKSIDLSKFNTELLLGMEYMFYLCGELTEINFTNFKTTSLISTYRMFYACFSLESLDLSSFDTSKVTDMRGMFYECSGLKSINFGNHFNTEKVTLMDRMFYNCRKLISLDLSQFKTPSLVELNYMFYYCSSLIILDISNFNLEKVEYANELFNGIPNLKYLNLLNVKLGNYDFSYTSLNGISNLTVCKRQGSFPFSNTNSKNFRCCETPFDTSKCNDNYILVKYRNFTGNLNGFRSRNTQMNKARIYLDNNDIDYFFNNQNIVIKPDSRIKIQFISPLTSMAYLFYNMPQIKSIDFSNFNSKEVTDMSHLFNLCTGLENINFGNNIDTSKVTNMDGLFRDCWSIKSIDLSKFNTELVWNMIDMFYKCGELTEINFTNFKTTSLISTNTMFYGCFSLESLDLSSFDTSQVTIMWSMFSECSGLKSINFGNNFNTEKVTNMGSMFYNCNKLISLNLSQFKTPSLDCTNDMFFGCRSLIILDISNFNLEKDNYIDFFFYGGGELKYLNLLNIKLGNYDLSNTALNYMDNLTVCKTQGSFPFSDTTSKIFRCCETPFNTSKCDYNSILVDYRNFTGNLNGFRSRNAEMNKARIYLNDNDIDYFLIDQNIVIKPGTRIKIQFINPLTSMAYLFYNMTQIKFF